MQIFVTVVVADKELMICLNKVTAKKTFQENTLSMGVISKQYVYFWKKFHGIEISSKTLKRRLAQYVLKKASTDRSDET